MSKFYSCAGCKYHKDCPGEVHCNGCARNYPDRYTPDSNMKVDQLIRCCDCVYCQAVGGVLYCTYWDYEDGSDPNAVEAEDFCSNAAIKIKLDN